ncbi:hypothetical protein ABW20_dc0109938 [Dactylellina cionopaga]|nr:hypothetical protein ABW20_dc0109938 [Dactylellina cionopaga]
MAQRYPARPSDNNNRQRGQHHLPPASYLRNPSDLQITSRTKLFIENLPLVVDESKLKKRFEVFGPLENANIFSDSESRVGLCTYKHHGDAFAAFQGMNKTSFEGNVLNVVLADATETYDESKARAASISSLSGDGIPNEYSDSITSNNDTSRNQMCDHQDTTTGHVCGESFPNTETLM